MNNNIHYVVIGYPLGKLTVNLNKYIIQYKNEVVELDEVEYLVWNMAWKHNSLSSILENCITHLGCKEDIIFKTIDALKSKNILIELNVENLDEIFKSISHLEYEKLGIGLGAQSIENGSEVFNIFNLEPIKVGRVEYAIWCEGGSNTYIGEVVFEIATQLGIDIDKNIKELVLAIMYLYDNRVIIFKG